MTLFELLGLSQETQAFIGEYQMFLSILGASTMSVAMILLRKVPLHIYKFIMRQIYCDLTIVEGTDMWQRHFKTLMDELFEKRVQITTRNFSTHRFQLSITLGPGTFYSYILNTLVKVTLRIEKNEAASDLGNTPTYRTLNIRVPIYRRKTLAGLLGLVEDVIEKSNVSKFHVSSAGSFHRSVERTTFTQRGLLIKQSTLDELTMLVKRCCTEPEHYIANKIPHREIIILYGVPGTGKSTVSAYLAAEHCSTLQRLDIAEILKKDMSGDISFSKDTSLYLIEDIDRNVLTHAVKTVSADGKAPLGDISNLLNFLDGVIPLSNCVVIMTTNNLALLDQAIYRTGRARLIEVGYIPNDEAISYLNERLDQPLVEYVSSHKDFYDLTSAKLGALLGCTSIEEVDKAYADIYLANNVKESTNEHVLTNR